jgi:hypothetical protein
MRKRVDYTGAIIMAGLYALLALALLLGRK